ncbi:MAG TPA: hypothetical protein VNH46_01040, partial [Gemmatimonadales bacterium]|nr:hypothetical protein [Gemmatimonadales bacterium]
MRLPIRSPVLILGATALGLGCGSSEPNRIPADLTVLSGDNQAGSVGTALPLPIVVQVEDRQGAALSGVTVSFTADGGGSVTPAAPRSDSRGRVAVSWTLGTMVTQTQSLTVTATGLSGVSRMLHARASP